MKIHPDLEFLRRYGWSQEKLENYQRLLNERSAWDRFTDSVAALTGLIAGVLVFVVLPLWAVCAFVKQVLLR